MAQLYRCDGKHFTSLKKLMLYPSWTFRGDSELQYFETPDKKKKPRSTTLFSLRKLFYCVQKITVNNYT